MALNLAIGVKKQYHILNGDALREQFPENLTGEVIIARECLVDGDVIGSDLDTLFRTRAQFISNNYDGYSVQDYFKETVPEFLKIQRIPANADINLWFEDDLFCQVNFWFVAHLLSKTAGDNQVFLVRPKAHNQYGFGALSKTELISSYDNRLALVDLNKIASLWTSYQNDDTGELIKRAQELEDIYPFILPAVEAHIERISKDGNMGRPTQALITIIKELKTEEFAPVFREFSLRESIYGFGDLQVKRLFDAIKNDR